VHTTPRWSYRGRRTRFGARDDDDLDGHPDGELVDELDADPDRDLDGYPDRHTDS
jgi:hypothetical protein